MPAGEAFEIVASRKHGHVEAVLTAARRLGLAEITVAREVIEVDQLPLLGTGKIDYPAVTRFAEQALSKASPAQSAALSLVRG